MKPKQTTDYLNDMITAYQITSMEDLAKMIGISRQAIHYQLEKKRCMAPLQAVKTAKLLDLPVLMVIAATQAEQAKTPDAKAIWTEIYLKELEKAEGRYGKRRNDRAIKT